MGIIISTVSLIQCKKDVIHNIEPTTSMNTTALDINTNSARTFIKMIPIPGRNFKLSETEVTIGQYLAFCRETNSHWPEWLEKGNKYNITTGSDKYYSNKGMSESNVNHPITGVSADDANAFCKWMGGWLPTMAEWEYAAKGGESYEYAGSDNIDEVAWYAGNSDNTIHPVKGKNPNGYGLYDMSGNVMEWTSSIENSYQYRRGGCWFFESQFCNVLSRYRHLPVYRGSTLGFRIATSK
jgi:formylglycine-generating enzyme required for sulfatase activity